MFIFIHQVGLGRGGGGRMEEQRRRWWWTKRRRRRRRREQQYKQKKRGILNWPASLSAQPCIEQRGLRYFSLTQAHTHTHKMSSSSFFPSRFVLFSFDYQRGKHSDTFKKVDFWTKINSQTHKILWFNSKAVHYKMSLGTQFLYKNPQLFGWWWNSQGTTTTTITTLAFTIGEDHWIIVVDGRCQINKKHTFKKKFGSFELFRVYHNKFKSSKNGFDFTALVENCEKTNKKNETKQQSRRRSSSFFTLPPSNTKLRRMARTAGELHVPSSLYTHTHGTHDTTQTQRNREREALLMVSRACFPGFTAAAGSCFGVSSRRSWRGVWFT